ncbi:MAG: hypothetical protein V1797_09175 [Pseudomonadota bacterium]
MAGSVVGPVIRLVSDDGDEQKPLRLICPFCGASNVGLDGIRERAAKAAAQAAGAISFAGEVIVEYQATCPRCRKVYVQCCPQGRLQRAS